MIAHTHTKTLGCFTSVFHPLPCPDSWCPPSGPLRLPSPLITVAWPPTLHSATDYPPLPLALPFTLLLSLSLVLLLPLPALLSLSYLPFTAHFYRLRKGSHCGYFCPLEFLSYQTSYTLLGTRFWLYIFNLNCLIQMKNIGFFFMRWVCVESLYRPGFFLSKNSVGIIWVFTKDVCHACSIWRQYLKLPPLWLCECLCVRVCADSRALEFYNRRRAV